MPAPHPYPPKYLPSNNSRLPRPVRERLEAVNLWVNDYLSAHPDASLKDAYLAHLRQRGLVATHPEGDSP